MPKTKNTKKKLSLSTLIFTALLLGALFGVGLHYLIPAGHIRDDIIIEGMLYVVGQGFIRLMQMLVVPLVFLFSSMWKYGDWRYKNTWKSGDQNRTVLLIYHRNGRYRCTECCFSH